MNRLGVWTLFKKETARFWAVSSQTLLAPVVSNVLFLLIFGAVFSGGVRLETGLPPGLIPGLCALGIMMNALQNPIGSLIVAKYTNAIQELLMLPLKGFEIVLAYIGAGVLRGCLVGLGTLAAGMLFTTVTFAHPGWIVIFTLLLGGIFASIGAACGALFNDFDQMAMVQNFIVTPLIYLGGVFFSVAALPGALQFVARLNPLFYLIDGFRYGFLGTSEAGFILSLSVTLALFVMSFGAASWIFHTGYRLKT